MTKTQYLFSGWAKGLRLLHERRKSQLDLDPEVAVAHQEEGDCLQPLAEHPEAFHLVAKCNINISKGPITIKKRKISTSEVFKTAKPTKKISL